MSRRKIIETGQQALPEHLDLSNWPMVNVDRLNPRDQQVFLRRKTAIELFIRNESTLQQILEITGVVAPDLRRFFRRCIELDEHGVVWGYRALIPRKRIKSYERSIHTAPNQDKQQKLTGAFQQLLNNYPSVKERIDDLYLERKSKTPLDPVMRIKNLHRHFLNACRDAGIKPTEYPFSTQELARRSLERYVKKLQEKHFSEASKRFGEDAARASNSTGIGEMNYPMLVRPFERVQFDGHRIDGIFTISFTTPEGDLVTETLDRLWLLVILDVATRCVLGYHISLNKEYTADDVLKCIRNAILPWKPKQFTITGLNYPVRGGFASNVIPTTEWGIWDDFQYDNAKANLAIAVTDRLKHTVGCSINPGPVKMPERRSFIERFFGILEENGYHRLINTTGSNPKDPRRRDPEKKALQYNISIEHLFELTEVLIANYNGTPHGGINNLSPLEAMEQRVTRGLLVRQITDDKRNEVAFLTMRTQRTVKGNIRVGKRPFINFEGVPYRSDVLARNPALIGKTLDLFVNTDDLRVLKAFFQDGSEFGFLYATGKWALRAHSLETRRAINRLKKRKLIHFTTEDDPIEVYQLFLTEHAKTKKGERAKLAKMQQIEKQDSQTQPIKNKENKTESSPRQRNILKGESTSNPKVTQINNEQQSRKLRKTIIF